MILVDALYINSGGGKVLLDYLIQELEKTDKIEQKFSITTREMGLSNDGKPIYYIATGVDADKLDLLENEEVKCERAFKAAEKLPHFPRRKASV